MGKLEKYSSYKDSGVEWLGEIPKEWEIKKLKFTANNKTIKSVESDFKIALENIESQTTKYIETQEIVFSEAGINFKKGDVLFGKLRPYLAKVYLAEKDGLCVSEFLVLESKQIKNLFLKYMLVSYSCIEHINSSTYGTKMPRASWNFIGNSLIPIPQKEEQIKIASFLDKKTVQIDEVISQKEKLIELLKERKQIVINDAVTKGLDKNVEFVDSGIEWIGEIPKHWKLERLGSNFIERREKVSDKDFEPLSVTKNGVVPQLDSAAKSNDGDNRKLVRKGDFVINSRSDRKGSSGLSKLDGSVSLINIVLKPININSDFSHILLKSNGFIEEFYRNGHGIVADLWTTRFWDMKSIMLAIPPKDEQLQIVEHIENQITKIDKAIELQQNYISKLKEYKASLIDGVVTGKVRVS